MLLLYQRGERCMKRIQFTVTDEEYQRMKREKQNQDKDWHDFWVECFELVESK